MNEIRKLIETIEQINEITYDEDVMRRLQKKLTDLASETGQYAEVMRNNFPQLRDKYLLLIEIEMELDKLRKRVFDVR